MADRDRPLTLYDIAKRAKTSPTTVSLVLNDKWRAHRIRPETAAHVARIAREADFSINLRARGLRLARSGLAGMIIPHYQNRFFAGLSESFEAAARQHGLCPAVISTGRDPERERDAVAVLLAQKVESLFITGATDPRPLNALCRRDGTAFVDLDIPGDGPSVVSDNRLGAHQLASRLLEMMAEKVPDNAAGPSAKSAPDTAASNAPAPTDLVFIGGRTPEYATDERLKGFRQALTDRGHRPKGGQVIACGYEPAEVEAALAKLYDRIGRLPAGLFVNSIGAFEGAVQFIKTLPQPAFADLALGCFDWNPFAAFLPIPVVMIRQDVGRMMELAFAFLDGTVGRDELVPIPPVLVDER